MYSRGRWKTFPRSGLRPEARVAARTRAGICAALSQAPMLEQYFPVMNESRAGTHRGKFE